jgi:hypothetical protein
MPPIFIGGVARYPPPLTAIAQVDGSLSNRIARAAVIFTRASGTESFKNIYHLGGVQSSTETEWAAVYSGLMKGLELHEGSVLIENDCLGVINNLMQRDAALKHEYARYYRSKILTGAAQFEWVGVRWIPRELNKADELFRGDKHGAPQLLR